MPTRRHETGVNGLVPRFLPVQQTEVAFIPNQQENVVEL
jgi:hypothetical protein